MSENKFIICTKTIKDVYSQEKTIIISEKTKEEYIEEIQEILVNKKIIKSGKGLNNHTIGEIYDIRKECNDLAKAVADRLFGEGK